MSKMAKLIAVAAIVFTVIGLSSTSAKAADTATFNITVTVQYVQITISKEDDSPLTEWAVGTTRALDTAYPMGAGEGVKIAYVCNVAFDIESYVSAEGLWSVGDAVGSDTFMLQAKYNAAVSGTGYTGASGTPLVLDNTNDGDDDVQANVTADVTGSAACYVYYQITTPNAISDLAHATPGTITVTVKVAPNA